jgi:ribosomal protein S8
MKFNNLADMIARINVAKRRRLWHVNVRYTEECAKIATKLLLDGYLRNFEILDNKTMRIHFYYHYNTNGLRELRLISSPGFKRYFKIRDLKSKYFTFANVYLWTNAGLLDLKEAIAKNQGGYAILSVN